MTQNLSDCINLNISKFTISKFTVSDLTATVSLHLLNNFQTEFTVVMVFISLITISVLINTYINVKSYKNKRLNNTNLLLINNDKE